MERVLEPPEGVGRDVLESGVGDLEVDDLEVLEDEVGEALHRRVVDVEELHDDALGVGLHRRDQQGELSGRREALCWLGRLTTDREGGRPEYFLFCIDFTNELNLRNFQAGEGGLFVYRNSVKQRLQSSSS